MKTLILIEVVLLFVAVFLYIGGKHKTEFVSLNNPDEIISTFSIVAFDPETGDVGVAVQSKFPNLRPVVPWAEAGVGAVATQSFANVSFGPKGLALIRNGATAEEALKILIANDDRRHQRQVGVVDAKGNSATWTGDSCFDWAGGNAGGNLAGRGKVIAGKYFAAQGNILVSKETVEAMVKVFQETKGSLADKLVASLIAGGNAGGDRRGEQSAALLVKRKGAGYDATDDSYIDISIYDHPTPLKELKRLYEMHKLYFFRTDPKNLVKIDKAICTELQQIMKDRELYNAEVNGVFDAKTKQALQDFMGWENYDVRIRDDDQIDKEVLEDMRKVYDEWKKTHR
jgi:uncharacterized Ntn-hydrolase superfamily protein